MQAGEVIWLLAGIGIGLTIAIGMLAIVAALDGRRLRRRREGGAVAAEPLPLTPRDAPPATRKPLLRPLSSPRRLPAETAAEPPPRPKLSPEPLSAPAPRAPAPVVTGSVEPAAQVVDEMISDLAAEIARVQVSPPVVIEIPAPEPMQVVVAEPAPVIETPAPIVAPPQTPVVDSPPEVSQPVAPQPVVATPTAKVPPLPKVPPARKFAPALPPRDKPGA